LSQQSVSDGAGFKETLAGGIRLVLALIMPATFGLFALAVPIVDLLFGHGAFTFGDVEMTALVLRVYLIGLPFAAVDQMLIFAFYASKDTWRPAIVGVISLIVYMFFAVGTLWLLSGPRYAATMTQLAAWLGVSSTEQLGLLSLMIADAAKHMSHVAMMAWLLRRRMGGLAGYGVWATLFKATTAAAVTGLAAYLTARWIVSMAPAATFLNQLLVVGMAGAVGVAVYMALVYVLDLRELKVLLHRLKRK
jgi:putative peptidoglycan lipid II flippase